MDQNFMKDSVIAGKIIESARIRPDETVLEIGAGKGFLTRRLAKKAKKVIAVEIDKRLRKHLIASNVRVIIGNALDEIRNLEFDKIVANTPYSISEPLFKRLIFKDFKLALLTLPRGFAYILTARENDPKFSSLSIMARTFYRIEILFDVPKEAFDPKPAVNSVVIRIIPRKEKTMEKLLFLQPKKLVKNALMEALCDYKKMTKSQSRKAIKSFNLNNIVEKKVSEMTTKEWQRMVISLENHT